MHITSYENLINFKIKKQKNACTSTDNINQNFQITKQKQLRKEPTN